MGEAGGEGMRLEMVDGDEGPLADQRQRLGGDRADDEPADEAGPGRDRHRVELGQRDLRAGQRAADDEVERLDMVARGDLGHHAAIGLVGGDLRQHLFGRHRDHLLDVPHRGTRKRDQHVGHRHVDLRLLLARRDQHGEQAEEQRDEGQQRRDLRRLEQGRDAA